jgi:SpoIID/LytB domain protein
MRVRPAGDRDSATKFHVSFSMDLEDYVLGIAEMPTSWKKAALKAQAVAARTYAAAKVHQRETGARSGNGVNPGFPAEREQVCWCHVYSSTLDQAYAGWFVSQIPSWAEAVTESAGEVVTFPNPAFTSNGVIDAFYGSSTVGVTETLAGGFGSTSSRPYLQSVDDHWGVDPGVGNPYATWSATVGESTLTSALATTSSAYAWQISFDYLIDVTLVNGPPEAVVRVEGSVGGSTQSVDVPGWWFKFNLGVTDVRSPQITAVDAVVTGSPHGQLWSQGGSVQSPIEAGDRFGSAMAVGDFDNDGQPDVAVSAPTDGVNAVAEGGLVNVLFGDGFGLTSDGDMMLHQDQPGMRQGAQAADHFGTSTVSGDFDGDGKWDLVVGVPDEDVGGKVDAGLIHSYSGSGSGLIHDAASPFSQKTKGILGSLDAGDRFGAALAAGDFNSDGFADLAVGSPGRKVSSKEGAGMVTIIPGSADGLDADASYNLHQAKKNVSNAPEFDDRFGDALAVGDLDGDGHDDLIVGSPGEGIGGTPGAGMVHVFFGGAPHLKGKASSSVHQGFNSIPGSSQSGDGFGSALAAGDIDGDGRDDVAIGVPGEDLGGKADAGRVLVVFGSASRSVSHVENVHLGLSSVAGDARANDRFGHALLVTDVVAGPRADLIVGIPNKKRSGKASAGAILVVPGKTGPGLNLKADRIFDQDDLPEPGTVETGDEFGFSLAGGDFDGDGRPELIVGSPGETLDAGPDAGVMQIAANFD